MTRQERVLLDLEEAAEVMGVERTTVYRLVRAGEIPALKIGKLWKVPKDLLLEWIHDQARANLQGDGDAEEA